MPLHSSVIIGAVGLAQPHNLADCVAHAQPNYLASHQPHNLANCEPTTSPIFRAAIVKKQLLTSSPPPSIPPTTMTYDAALPR